jgi:hypothetical protein
VVIKSSPIEKITRTTATTTTTSTAATMMTTAVATATAATGGPTPPTADVPALGSDRAARHADPSKGDRSRRPVPEAGH